MKNFCLLLLGLMFLTSLPTFADRLILNDNNDRIVYSRSSRPDDTEVYINNNDNNNIKLVSYYKTLYKNPDYNKYYLGLLGSEFRPELAGTKWDFGNNAKPSNVIQTKNKSLYNRDSREASDYYMVDNKKDPDKIIPSGY